MQTTRESWLLSVTDGFRPEFEGLGHPLPHKLRATVGWPSRGGLSPSKRVIGECWSPAASRDGSVEIFISPTQAEPIDVMATLVHELVHAALRNQHEHKGPFKRLATQIGLQGPMRSTHAGGQLTERLNALLQRIGPYPHAILNASTHRKKQGTRLIKCSCLMCGYTVRITRKWLEVGVPTCPCGWIIESDIFMPG